MHSYPVPYGMNPDPVREEGQIFRQYVFDKPRALATYSMEEIFDDSPIARGMRNSKHSRSWMNANQLNEFYCTLRLLCDYSGKQANSRTDLCLNCYAFRFRVAWQKHIVLNHYESIPLTWILDTQHPGFETFEYVHVCWQKFLEKFLDYFHACGFAIRERPGNDILFRLPFFMTCRYNHRKEGHDAFLAHYLQRDLPNPLATYPGYKGPLTQLAQESIARMRARELEQKRRIDEENAKKDPSLAKQKGAQADADNQLSIRPVESRGFPEPRLSVDFLHRAPELQFPGMSNHYVAPQNLFAPRVDQPIDYRVGKSNTQTQRPELAFNPIYYRPRTTRKKYGSSSSRPTHQSRQKLDYSQRYAKPPYGHNPYVPGWQAPYSRPLPPPPASRQTALSREHEDFPGQLLFSPQPRKEPFGRDRPAEESPEQLPSQERDLSEPRDADLDRDTNHRSAAKRDAPGTRLRRLQRQQNRSASTSSGDPTEHRPQQQQKQQEHSSRSSQIVAEDAHTVD